MGYPPSGDQKSSVISERSVDSLLKLMVESFSSGGRGAEPSITHVTDRQENIMQGMFSHTDKSQREKSHLHRIQDHDLLCSGAEGQCVEEQHQQECPGMDCTTPCGTKLPNGHASHNAHKVPKSSQPAGCVDFIFKDNNVIANGELSEDSRDLSVEVGTSEENIRTSMACALSELATSPQDGDENRTIGSELVLNPQNSVFNQALEGDTTSFHESEPHFTRNPSGSPSAALTHSLRKFSSSTFFNANSRQSPDDDETFPSSDKHDDLTLMDMTARNTYEISRRQSAPDNIPGVLSVASTDLTRKHGISEIFSRSLFSRKQREAQSAPGWKLFGKVPLRESPPKDSRTIQQESNRGNLTSVSTPNLLSSGEYEAKVTKSSQSPSLPAQGRRKNLEFEPLSTTGLILEDRPANLPAKSEEEAQRHRQEYDEMVAEAKKRELKEAQKKKKQMKERFKQEECIANAMVVWNNEILPNWENMRGTRRVRDLWWQGLPPNVRGKVWSLAIGNELNITSELYEIFLSRAKERWKSFSETESEVDSGASVADRESSLELIKLDISRTFPSLFIFQKGGPYHDLLHSVLGAYTCYRPDVGYVQGMSFIAAVLILNLEEADAFIAFANLLNKPCQLAFFRVDHELMLKYFAAFEVFFEENLPKLLNHFRSYNLTPDLYLIDWIFTLYSKSLPLDVACRVWDVFCRDGEEFLFRTGLGILRLYEEVLLQMDFIHIAQFLTRLPEDTPPERLFNCIANTQMISSNRKWTQVFSALV
ncbi:TBC1 domain family member 12-like [Xyrauchen texanus]|uniref:TBC1 domain family member 12-like n=1 Tax=Xyrauchen texanus TaxID=154827 RepID=UPI0022425228|nr:TBC1 domain family member 12-like [Xyrauchen texanus]